MYFGNHLKRQLIWVTLNKSIAEWIQQMKYECSAWLCLIKLPCYRFFKAFLEFSDLELISMLIFNLIKFEPSVYKHLVNFFVCRHYLSLTSTLSSKSSWNFIPAKAGFKLFVWISCQISACSIRSHVAVLIPSHCCSKSFLLSLLTGKPPSLFLCTTTLSNFWYKTFEVC